MYSQCRCEVSDATCGLVAVCGGHLTNSLRKVSPYICIYIYAYVCVYVYVCIFICICICICLCLYVLGALESVSRSGYRLAAEECAIVLSWTDACQAQRCGRGASMHTCIHALCVRGMFLLTIAERF